MITGTVDNVGVLDIAFVLVVSAKGFPSVINGFGARLFSGTDATLSNGLPLPLPFTTVVTVIGIGSVGVEVLGTGTSALLLLVLLLTGAFHSEI